MCEVRNVTKQNQLGLEKSLMEKLRREILKYSVKNVFDKKMSFQKLR